MRPGPLGSVGAPWALRDRGEAGAAGGVLSERAACVEPAAGPPPLPVSCLSHSRRASLTSVSRISSMSEGSSTCGTEAARRRSAAGALGGASQGLHCLGGAPVRCPPRRAPLRCPSGARAAPERRGPAARGPAVRGRGGAPSHGRPTPPLPGLTALTRSACLAAHQAGVVDELVHLASVRGQGRAQGRGQASRAPGRRWRACSVLDATSGGRPPEPPVAGGRLSAPSHLRDGGLHLALHEADGGVAQVHDQLVVELLLVRVPRAWVLGVGGGVRSRVRVRVEPRLRLRVRATRSLALARLQ